MVKCIPEFEFFTVFLKNRNISSKIKRSKVTDYAALRFFQLSDIKGRADIFCMHRYLTLIFLCVLTYIKVYCL